MSDTHLYLLIHDSEPCLTYCKKDVIKGMKAVTHDEMQSVTCKKCLNNLKQIKTK